MLSLNTQINEAAQSELQLPNKTSTCSPAPTPGRVPHVRPRLTWAEQARRSRPMLSLNTQINEAAQSELQLPNKPSTCSPAPTPGRVPHVRRRRNVGRTSRAKPVQCSHSISRSTRRRRVNFSCQTKHQPAAQPQPLDGCPMFAPGVTWAEQAGRSRPMLSLNTQINEVARSELQLPNKPSTCSPAPTPGRVPHVRRRLTWAEQAGRSPSNALTQYSDQRGGPE